ncbi:Importin subunit beta-5 [Wickerhamomyces ciferrii]|uniref:Importin subunit beta-5 n=1 Tax=Wickerhamomyces ciferrii (strain ATCC 14091 / BCRC 22168 / CBS 111 / JCM 3599 / NBRC 0793 / NRRL Y-1031 F-60-10) TaxID=1206466 RepID=K0KQB8_WICCF|nr:Importin subunit beta-5 [Wickerhamomyces ciferrii]CCH44347.1 Importin subunit beta-5 [Wickerhamomyces ciferrii]
MESAILDVLHRIQLPDNATRKHAENELAEIVRSNPSQAAVTLIKLSATSSFNVAARQSALLNLKRIVPLFWSAGFESFVGPAINQNAKSLIRDTLINLVTSDKDSKIRNGASYAVVQISAVDFPDEWPDLLDVLYSKMTSLDPIAVLGGLSLLQELFDDLVTEELFFEGGVGNATITECMNLLTNEHAGDKIKTAAANLYKSCLLQLQSPAVTEDPNKKAALEQHFGQIVTLLTVLLQNHILNIHSVTLRTTLYSIAYILNTEFPQKLFPKEAKLALQQETINDVISSSKVYVELVVLENEDKYTENNDPEINTSIALSNLLIEQFQFLGSLGKLQVSNSPVEYFLDSVLASSFVPLELEDNWVEDFNEFVTEETGVSPTYLVRNAVYDYVSELGKTDANYIYQWLVNKLLQFDKSDDWRSKEALLYVLGGLMENENDIKSETPLGDVLNGIASLLQDNEILVRVRVLLTIPDFLKMFEKSLNSSEFGIKSIVESLKIIALDQSSILKTSFLISLLSYNSFLKFESIPIKTQEDLYTLIESLLEEARDDTSPLLAEVLKLVQKIQKTNIRSLRILMQLAQKDPGNIQLVLDIEEALEDLFEDLDLDTYVKFVGSTIEDIKTAIGALGPDYSALLVMLLQTLNIFIYSCPENIPRELFPIYNHIISTVLLNTNDEQVLQVGAEGFTSLINKSSSEYFELEIVLKILEKYFNPEISDSGALFLGSFVVAVLKRFENQIQNVLPNVLSAVTNRLITAKEISTIEDLLSVLCYMIEIDLEHTMEFLQNLEIQKVFNIWFNNFQTLRGEKIEENVHALGKLFSSQVEFNFTVDGDEYFDPNSDIIITRSMKHKQQYQQVSVPFKIIKLLVFELGTQSLTHDQELGESHGHDHDHGDQDDDEVAEDIGEDGWEDLDDIGGDFDKLKSYIDDDDRGHGDSNNELKGYLIQFFKNSASQNIHNFREIYEQLTEEEKLILTNNIV